MLNLLAASILTICAPGPAVKQPSCVTDGDSFRLDLERIRLADIDTPELSGKCPYERALALRARDRLRELLSRGFEIERTGADKYRRTLGIVRVEGRSVGEILVAEKLARKWEGRRKSWC